MSWSESSPLIAAIAREQAELAIAPLLERVAALEAQKSAPRRDTEPERAGGPDESEAGGVPERGRSRE